MTLTGEGLPELQEVGCRLKLSLFRRSFLHSSPFHERNNFAEERHREFGVERLQTSPGVLENPCFWLFTYLKPYKRSYNRRRNKARVLAVILISGLFLNSGGKACNDPNPCEVEALTTEKRAPKKRASVLRGEWKFALFASFVTFSVAFRWRP